MNKCPDGCNYQLDLDAKITCVECNTDMDFWSSQTSFEE